MRLTTKGQVTIPQGIREVLGLMPLSEVEFDIVDNSVRIRKKAVATPGTKTRGQRMLEAMARAPKPKPGMTTDELMALTRGK
jgi:AbrB family looped-hinge helix DNA binding protein